MRIHFPLALAALFGPLTAGAAESGCPGSVSPDPNVIFCENYDTPDVSSRFVEHNQQGGAFVQAAGVGMAGSPGMKVTYGPGQVSAGWMIRSFGRAPPSFYPPQSHAQQDFREIYWREYVRTEPGWSGAPHKLSRVYGIGGPNWSQSMIAHLWTAGDQPHMALDPASGISTSDQLVTTTYNDFANLRWLGGANPIDPGWSGSKFGSTPVYAPQNANRWFCIEAHATLNAPGQADGVFEFWIDGRREARLEGLNWVGSWQDFGINAISLENYWNGGSPQQNVRYRDNLVVSRARIGCLGDKPPPAPSLRPSDWQPPSP